MKAVYLVLDHLNRILFELSHVLGRQVRARPLSLSGIRIGYVCGDFEALGLLLAFARGRVLRPIASIVIDSSQRSILVQVTETAFLDHPGVGGSAALL